MSKWLKPQSSLQDPAATNLMDAADGVLKKVYSFYLTKALCYKPSFAVSNQSVDVGLPRICSILRPLRYYIRLKHEQQKTSLLPPVLHTQQAWLPSIRPSTSMDKPLYTMWALVPPRERNMLAARSGLALLIAPLSTR